MTDDIEQFPSLAAHAASSASRRDAARKAAQQQPPQSQDEPPEPPPTLLQRFLHLLMWVVPSLLLLLVVIVVGLWIWTGSQSSLAQSIALAQRFVPAASALHTSGVEGSLREGGRIASLRWDQPEGVTVVVDKLQIAWQPLALLTGTFRVNPLSADRVQVIDRTPKPANPEPSQPLKSLLLPVRVDVPQIRIGHFAWDEPEAFSFDKLDANYSYNGLTHELKINNIALVNGEYNLHAKMASQAPLNIAAELKGELHAPMPEGEQPVPFSLQAKVTGPLELLDISAQAQAHVSTPGVTASQEAAAGESSPAQPNADSENKDGKDNKDNKDNKSDSAADAPDGATTAGTNADANADPQATAELPKAEVNARIAIWQQGFPVQKADVSLSRLNLRAFLPSLPDTLLDGEANITPLPAKEASGDDNNNSDDEKNGTATSALPPLHVYANIRNGLSGPWDKQRLPFDKIQLQGNWAQNPEGQTASVQQLLIILGSGEFGGSGQFSLASSAATPPAADTASAESPATADTSANAQANTSAEAEQQPAPPTPLPIWQAQADLKLQNINPQEIYSTLAAAPLTGSITARTRAPGTPATPEAPATPSAGTEAIPTPLPPPPPTTQPGVDFDVDITGKPPARGRNLLWLQQLAARGAWADDAVSLESLKLASNQARVQGSGRYDLKTQAATAKADISLPGLKSRIDGNISPNLGKGNAALDLANASQTLAWARQLPGMDKLLAGQQLSGRGKLNAKWQGGWLNPAVDANLNVPQLALAPSGKSGESGRSAKSSKSSQSASKSSSEAMSVSALQARLQGRLDQASLSLQGQASAAGQRIDLATQVNGGNKAREGQPPRWVANITQLRVRADDPTAPAGSAPGQWTLETSQPLNLTWQNQTLEASKGSARLSPPARVTSDGQQNSLPITWEPLRLRTNEQGISELKTAGAIEGLPFAWANALSNGKLAASGITGDLSLNANWNILLDKTLDARIAIERAGGDLNLLSQENLAESFAMTADQISTPPGRGTTKITIIDPKGTSTASSNDEDASEVKATPAGRRLTAGIKTARVLVTASNSQVEASLDWDTRLLGQASARINSPISRRGGTFTWADDAPLSGQLRASLTRLGIWSVLAPPGWRMRGQLEADATITGTRNKPLLRGTLEGSKMALRSVLDGVELTNGQFKASLDGSKMVLNSFSLDGAGGGNVTAQGQADWTSGEPDMRIEARINQLRVTNRADRQVTVSGNLLSTLAGKQLALTGNVNVDKALIILPESSTPTLGNDVNVIDPAKAEAEAAAKQDNTQAIVPRVDVTLDMGNDFKLQGYGINTYLRGQLKALVENGTPQITGSINTADGEFRAYGQWLNIERGVIRFTGAYDNPSLDILAIRPRLTQRVGVQVTGPAISPVIRLYSDPELADSEKLAWLLLGRSGAEGGAEAAMLQQAAVAALSGGSSGPGIAGMFGLDQLSVGGTKNEAGETEASVTVGKQLAKDLYVTYERTLSGALGTFYVFYDLSRRWTLRGQSGEDSAVDLIFTLPYDKL